MRDAYATRQRKYRSKMFNERLKLFTSALNALALAVIISAFVFPVVRSGNVEALNSFFTWFWLTVSVILHLSAQFFLGFLKSED